MTQMPFFSVIVPVYNVAPFVRECIKSLVDSAAAAEGVRIELVCVDDGSTDGSGDILDELARETAGRGANISMRVIHTANAGVSAARNLAMDEAKGDWLTFVDADDFVRPTYFSDIAAALAAYPDSDLIGFGITAYSGGAADWSDGENVFKDVSIADSLSDELVNMGFTCFAYRRDIVNELRFKPYTLGEDLIFETQAFVRARKCMITQRKEYAYRNREGSATLSGMSVARLRVTVSFHVEMFRVLESSGKRIGRAFTEGRGSMWIEEVPRYLLTFRKTADGLEVWNEWLDSMSVAAGLSILSESQRRRARNVAARRTAWSVRWNCRLPAWLRRKGFRI